MKKEDWLEELSAYLDGESDRASAVKRAVEQEPALRSRLEEYQRASHAVRDLPKPDVHPAFATRVMASIQEEPEPSKFAAFLQWRPLLAGLGVASLVVVVALPIWLNQETVNQDVQLVTNAEPILLREELLDEEQVLDEMAELMDQGEEFVLFEESEYEELTSESTGGDWLDAVYEDVYASLDTSAWEEEPLPVRPETDVFMMVFDSLDEQESEELDSLLRTYLEEG